jgi:hypothetical protein
VADDKLDDLLARIDELDEIDELVDWQMRESAAAKVQHDAPGLQDPVLAVAALLNQMIETLLQNAISRAARVLDAYVQSLGVLVWVVG